MNLSLNALRKRHVMDYLREVSWRRRLCCPRKRTRRRIWKKAIESRIEQAVSRLPDKQRAVFVLRYYDELSYEEIAFILKTSVGGLKANYFHALRKVQRSLKHALTV